MAADVVGPAMVSVGASMSVVPYLAMLCMQYVGTLGATPPPLL